ncbi:hypothetical protein JYT20_01260 [Rhodothermus sp. AH-315-K08]|nr:hypothetical protein [Rhodothermus sp. AH-315-K08]
MVEDATGPQTITYRIETTNSEPITGVSYLESVVTPAVEIPGSFASPWEVTIPYFIGMKAVQTQLLPANAGATVTILIDGDVVSENVFGDRYGAVIIGALAGLPNYVLEHVIGSNEPETRFFLEVDGMDLPWVDTYRYQFEPDESASGGGSYRANTPTTFRFRQTGSGIQTVTVSHLGAAMHLFSISPPEPFDMSFTFDYDGR